MDVIAAYRRSIEGDHFDEVDRDLTNHQWTQLGDDVRPPQLSTVDRARELFDELHGAVANRDRAAALTSTERIEKWLPYVAD